MANLSDSATAGTAPVARSEDGELPIGVGVVCKAHDEDMVLRILYEWEEAFGGHIRPVI